LLIPEKFFIFLRAGGEVFLLLRLMICNVNFLQIVLKLLVLNPIHVLFNFQLEILLLLFIEGDSRYSLSQLDIFEANSPAPLLVELGQLFFLIERWKEKLGAPERLVELPSATPRAFQVLILNHKLVVSSSSKGPDMIFV
jgi:hypothetical protein